jgi:hypothetical protein
MRVSVLCGSTDCLRLVVADPPPTGEAAEDLVADLISVQFQNNINLNYGPHFGRSGGFAQV